MEHIEFVHISDLHLLCDYAGSDLESFVGVMGRTPTENAEALFDHIRGGHPHADFVLVTGDLAHDGSEPTYRMLSALMAGKLGDLPVYIALGNHDKRAVFRPAFGIPGDPDSPYCHEEMIDSTRFFFLDTCGTGKNVGRLEEEQLAWLGERLASGMGKGAFLALHHPPVQVTESGRTLPLIENSDALEDILTGSGLRGIFAGHIHESNVTQFAGIPLFSAGSTAFGSVLTPEALMYTDRLSYNYCIADDARIQVRTLSLPGTYKTLYTRPLSF